MGASISNGEVGIGGSFGQISFSRNSDRVACPIWLTTVSAGPDIGIKGFKSPLIVRILKVLGILSHVSVDPGFSIGSSAGQCFPNPLKRKVLTPGDFSGACWGVLASGDAALGGIQGYLLFFGIPMSSMPLGIDPVAGNAQLEAAYLTYLATQSAGFAWISTTGIQFGAFGVSAGIAHGAIGAGAGSCIMAAQSRLNAPTS
jgi:hypothetical protein